MRWVLTNRLAECRAAKGIKKSQLAHYLGMSRAYVTRLERGDIRPSAEAMLRLAQYFGKPVEQVFQLAEPDTHGEEHIQVSEPKHKTISRPPSAASGKPTTTPKETKEKSCN